MFFICSHVPFSRATVPSLGQYKDVLREGYRLRSQLWATMRAVHAVCHLHEVLHGVYAAKARAIWESGGAMLQQPVHSLHSWRQASMQLIQARRGVSKEKQRAIEYASVPLT